MKQNIFKHKFSSGYGRGHPYVSPYLLEILSTRPGAPAWPCATGTLTANTGQTVSCSRASSAYCLGADGFLHLLSGNTVRVEPAGLLVEGASSNFFAQSNNFPHASWSKDTAFASSAQNVTGPDGVANSAWTLTQAVGGLGVRVYQNLGQAIQTTSVYAKPGTARYLWLDSAEAFGCVWDWQTLSFAVTGGTGSASYELLASGWYRIKCMTTAGAGAFTGIGWSNTNPGHWESVYWQNQVPDGTTAILWGAQEENLAAATSPIVTGAVGAARDADLVYIPAASNPLVPSVPGDWSMGMVATPLDVWYGATGNNLTEGWLFAMGDYATANSIGYSASPWPTPPLIFWRARFLNSDTVSITEQAPYIDATSTSPVTFLFRNNRGTVTGSPPTDPGSAPISTITAFQGDIQIGRYVAFPGYGFYGHIRDIVVHNTP